MKIHFVCVGNTYRSRLAEAYLNSLQIKGIEATSSGIRANRNENGTIAWDTKTILEKYGILNFASENWVQSSPEVLEGNNLTIFMEKNIYDFCVDELHSTIPVFEIWNIQDIDNRENPQIVLEQAEGTFLKIRNLVDDLVKRVS